MIAHLKTGVTTSNLAERAEWKLTLVQRTYENIWVNKDVIKIFNVVNKIMILSKLAQAEFSEDS